MSDGPAAEGEVESWPFSKAEWATVMDAARPVFNASLAEDAVVRASHFVGLHDVLARLRRRHGDHPVLLETEADFTEDDDERVSLYRRAVRGAEANGFQTLTIRLSLSRLLLDLGQHASARDELLACERELPDGNDLDLTSWLELLEGSCLLTVIVHPVVVRSRGDGWWER